MLKAGLGRAPVGLFASKTGILGWSLGSRIQRCTVVSRAAKQVSPQPEQPPKLEPPLPKQPPKVEPPQPENRAFRKFPKFMRKYAERVASAPASHVAAFLFVHELTAIIPLFGIWGGLWYFDYVPVGLPDWVVEKGSAFIRQMAERNNWTIITNAESGSKLVLQGAVAYGAVKALMPVRLAFSLWAMPWTAKWLVIPFTNIVGRIIRRIMTQKP